MSSKGQQLTGLGSPYRKEGKLEKYFSLAVTLLQVVWRFGLLLHVQEAYVGHAQCSVAYD